MDEQPGGAGGDERGHLVQLLAIGAVASAVGIALALAIDWWPRLASEEGAKIDRLYDILLIVSVPVFVLVIVVVLYCVWRFRMRPGQEQLDGPPIHGNTRIEIVWTALPALLLVALCSYAFIVLDDIEDAKSKAPLQVRVVGEQFTWTFFYKNPRGGQEISSNRLNLPVNTAVLFQVQTKDVLHDFFIPEFRLKIDAVPGITTNFKATTTGDPGTYPVVCAELCGLGHSVMRQTANVMPKAEYDGWLRRQAAGGGGPAGAGGGQAGGGAEQPGGAADGRALFTSSETGCGQCHTLAAAGTGGTIGPNLGESLAGKDEAYIRRAILDPNADVPDGFQPGIMPSNFEETLKPEEVDALVKYLAGVSK